MYKYQSLFALHCKCSEFYLCNLETYRHSSTILIDAEFPWVPELENDKATTRVLLKAGQWPAARDGPAAQPAIPSELTIVVDS